MNRLLALPLFAVLALAAGCPKTETATAPTPVPTATPDETGPGKGRVDSTTVPPESMLKAANGWHGTYKNLLAVIHAPEDKTSFSQFSEFGWKDAFAYKEYGAQPAGWWVYVAPYWFVWDTRDGQKEQAGPGGLIPTDGKTPPAGGRNGFIDPTSLPGHIVFRAALGKQDARYTNMLAALQDPDDVKEFSKFSEFGWQPTRNYKTYGQSPAGFWVYVEPYWIVWNLKDGKTGP